MKRFSPSRFTHWLRSQLTTLRHQRFFQDKLSLGILLAAIAGSVLTLLVLATRLHPTDYPIPIHYTNLYGFDSGFDSLGPWYQLYSIGAFSLLTTIVNGALALKAFHRSRITSFFLLISAFVVSVFCLIISIAFTSVLTP